MKRVILIILIFLGYVGFSQHEVLLKIDTMPVYADEFLYVYKKNNRGQDSLPLKDYLNLFINYKLKVYQALREGYDKDSAFKAEYHKYLVEAAKPYFYSKTKENQLLHEYYNRMKKEVRFSYLAKQIPQNAKPQDTASIYTLLMKIRQRALNGEDFTKLILSFSDSKRRFIDKGDAGYVTAFGLPPQMADFLWKSKVGDISMPIRFGNFYYLIKKTDERPYSGEVHVAQIYVALPYKADKEDSIKAYKKVQIIDSMLHAGKKFEEVARVLSDDYRSARHNGDLGWISVGRTIPEFERAAFSLKHVGDTVRVRTRLGIHYIKLLGRRNLQDFEHEKENILKNLRASGIYKQVYNYTIDSLKKAYHYKMIGSLDRFYQQVSPDILEGKWHDTVLIHDNTVLFTLNGQIYTNADFARYLLETQRPTLSKNLKKYIDNKYKKFVEQQVKTIYALQLAKNQNTEFGRLAKEFYDGLLLFNISNDKVWKKAAEDTAGLMRFYREHKAKYDTLAYVSVYQGTKSAIKKAVRALRKFKNIDVDSNLVKAINDTNLVFKEKKLISPSDHRYGFVFKIKHRKRFVITKSANGKLMLIVFNRKLPHIRGIVVADYQDYLDKKWIEQLRHKYKVQVNYQVLDKIQKQLEKQN